MGMATPSGGVKKFVGRLGDLKTDGKPNSRADLYNKNGEKIQSRWYVLHERITGKTIGVYTSMEDFKNNAKINGILLKDLWTFVENTDFLQG